MRRLNVKATHLLAATTAASVALAAVAARFPAAALAAEPRQSLEDVQIGEQGAIMRVALICTNRCEIAPDEDAAFRLIGVSANLDVDLAARSTLARRLTIAPSGAASILKVQSTTRLNEARVIECQSDSGPAPCIEFRFDVSAAASPAASPSSSPTAPQGAPPARLRETEAANAQAKSPTTAAAKSAPAKQTGDEPPFIGAMILAPRPSLRDNPAAGLFYLPEFGPPERFVPPQDAPAEPASDAQDVLGDLSGNIDIGRPSLIPVDRAEMLGQGAAFDFRAESIAILGKSFEVGVCEGAKARLSADAWALTAMIDLAFCKAADGKLEEADADFARLLAYTPDNYEALIGRGLIAFAAGDRARGQQLFQDALNSLPPIEESDRIVSAMERN